MGELRQAVVTAHSSWQELVASPRRASHIVQIYEDDGFLAAGVGLFAAEGLARGEAVLLSGTAKHLEDVRRSLGGHDIDVEGAIASSRLRLLDVRDTLRAAVVDGNLDEKAFRAAIDATIAAATRDSRSQGLRWWGELSNVLHHSANDRAALAAEQVAGEAIEAHACTVFCSYFLDRFDPRAYDGMLHAVCRCHSHVIPAEDYVGHRVAVNRAIADVMGEIRGAMLQSLLSWKGLRCELPSSQAVLFWLRDAFPERLPEVLARAKAYQAGEVA
jgi:hypothetical protein